MASEQPPEIDLKQHACPEGIAWLEAHPEVIDWLDKAHRSKLQASQRDGKLSYVDQIDLEGPPLRNRLQRYFMIHKRDGFVNVKYHYPRQSGVGRRYAREPSFQNLPRTVREILTCKTHIDIDFDNAHFVIFSQMCKKHDIQSPLVDSYIKDREVHLARLLSCESADQADRGIIKSLCLKVLNGGGVEYTALDGTKKTMADKWLSDLRAECREVQKQLCRLTAFAAEVACKQRQDNAEAKAINVAICKVENLCLEALCDFTVRGSLQPEALMFDGAMLRGTTLPSDFLHGAESHIFNETGYNMKLSQKPIKQHDLEALLAAAAAAAATATAVAEPAQPAARAARPSDGRIDTLVGILHKWISITAGMKSGKTYRAIQLIKASPQWSVLFITQRQAMASCMKNRCLDEKLSFVMYRDVTGTIRERRVILEYESLFRLQGVFDLVILDEWRSICETIQCVGTNKARLLDHWMKLKTLTVAAQKVLFMDADMLHDGASYEAQDALWNFCKQNERAYLEEKVIEERDMAFTGTVKLVHLTARARLDALNTGPPQPILRKTYDSAAMQRGILLATDAQIWEMIEADLTSDVRHRIMIVCGSVKEACAVQQRCGEIIDSELVGLYTGETNNREDFCDIKKAWRAWSVIIFTSTLTTGADYTELLYRAYLLPSTGASKPRDAHQQLGRARELTNTEYVVRWNGDHIRTVTKAQVDSTVDAEKEKLIQRGGLVERSVNQEKVKLFLALGTEYHEGEWRPICSDMSALIAYSNAESSFTHSDAEWMAYFMYIARRKNYTERILITDSDRTAALELAAKQAAEAEAIRRAQVFDSIDISRVPLYSVKALAAACTQLEQYSHGELTAAQQILECTPNTPVKLTSPLSTYDEQTQAHVAAVR
jgi:Origin of replication binding protein